MSCGILAWLSVWWRGADG